MRRRQQVFVQETTAPKSLFRRFFSSAGWLLVGAFMLLLSAIAVGLIAILLQKWFPQHTGTSRQTKSTSVPSDVQAYFDVVGNQVNASGTDLGALTQLASDATAKPALMKSPDWQTKASVASVALQAEGNALINIAPVPPACLAMNKDVRTAGARYLEIAREFSKGADTRPPDLNVIRSAVQKTRIVTEQDDKAMGADSDAIRARFAH